jgi:hypothetical protein
VKAFLRQAEEILDVAMAGDGDANDGNELAILIDRQGGMRMLDPIGWSLSALSVEFGAAAVYKVERRARTVRVEGWGGGERCLLQRNLSPRRPGGLPGMPAFGHPLMQQRPLPDCEQRLLSAQLSA